MQVVEWLKGILTVLVTPIPVEPTDDSSTDKNSLRHDFDWILGRSLGNGSPSRVDVIEAKEGVSQVMLVTVVTVWTEIEVGADGTLPSHACDAVFVACIARYVGMSNSYCSRIIDTEIEGCHVSCSVVCPRSWIPLNDHSLLRSRWWPSLIMESHINNYNIIESNKHTEHSLLTLSSWILDDTHK